MNSISGSEIASRAERSRRENASKARRTMSAFSAMPGQHARSGRSLTKRLGGQREAAMLAGELVPHLDEDVEHRLLGGRQEGVLQRRGHDLAHGRLGAQRAN